MTSSVGVQVRARRIGDALGDHLEHVVERSELGIDRRIGVAQLVGTRQPSAVEQVAADRAPLLAAGCELDPIPAEQRRRRW
ncbi:MAG: hypothetical protein R2713_16175 [Ilumatobacteraceae bacterium]